MTRLSVITPVYNAERFLDESLASVAAQDYSDYEHFVIDDGSTDGSPRIIARWAERDSRVRPVYFPSNQGLANAINEGLRRARGEFVAQQDADDVALPGRFRRSVQALDAHPGAAMVAMAFTYIDEQGRTFWTSRRCEPPAVIAFAMHFHNAIGGHSQVMYRREVVQRLGGYDPLFRGSCDTRVWSRLIRHGDILTLHDVGMAYRFHAAQLTSTTAASVRHSRNVAIAQTTMAETLGREVPLEDAEAAVGAWEGEPSGGDVARGDALIEELYAAFEKSGTSAHDLARIRAVTASRLGRTALLRLRGGDLDSAHALMRNALRWDREGAISGPIQLVRDSLTIRSGRMLARWSSSR